MTDMAALPLWEEEKEERASTAAAALDISAMSATVLVIVAE